MGQKDDDDDNDDNLSMFWGRQLNLSHAAIGSLHGDPDTPTAITEIKQNVLRWKKRVEVQISMAFFLNKIIRIFFWVLLLSFIPVSSILLRFFLCDPIADKWYLRRRLNSMMITFRL